jgi:hypothetical protein
VLAAGLKDGDIELVAEDPHPNEPRWISTKLPAWEKKTFDTKIDEGADIDIYRRLGGTFFDEEDVEMENRRFQYGRVSNVCVASYRFYHWSLEEQILPIGAPFFGRHISLCSVSKLSIME